MTDSSLLSLLFSMGLGGTAVFFIIGGLFMVGILFIILLIISEIIFSFKENATIN